MKNILMFFIQTIVMHTRRLGSLTRCYVISVGHTWWYGPTSLLNPVEMTHIFTVNEFSRNLAYKKFCTA